MTKKEWIGLILFIIVAVVMFFYGKDRFEKIDNGEMIVVSQSEMDR